MSKIKLNALSPEEQIDVLSRVYIREVTKPVNKWLSGSVRRAGGEYNAQLNMGKVKNMFLSGSMEANDFAYAVGNSKYETNRFSVVGGLYNYIYRSRLIDELRNNYSVERGISRAYGYVRTYGYEEFYTYMKNAFVPTSPSSVVDEATRFGQTSAGKYILDETISTSSITLEDFSKEQIAVVKEYMKEKVSKYMQSRGFSTHDIEGVFSHIDRMRTTPYIDKNKGQTEVKKPSKKLEGFLISLPQTDLTAIQTEYKVEPTSQAESSKPAVAAPVKNEATGLTLAEELELMRELDESESVIVKSTDAYDSQGTPLCQNQKGLYCYVDGTPFRGDTIYDEYGGVYEDLKTGLVYGAKERAIEEETEDDIGDLFFASQEEDDNVQVVDGVTYKNGYMVTDGGHVISPEEYPDEDVEDTKLDKDKFKPYSGTQIEMDLGPKQ